jgi:hypothetical protein
MTIFFNSTDLRRSDQDTFAQNDRRLLSGAIALQISKLRLGKRNPFSISILRFRNSISAIEIAAQAQLDDSSSWQDTAAESGNMPIAKKLAPVSGARFRATHQRRPYGTQWKLPGGSPRMLRVIALISKSRCGNRNANTDLMKTRRANIY